MGDTLDQEINDLIRLGRKYKWSTGDVRRRLEEGGINLARSDFYSDTPTLKDVETSFEYDGSDDGANTRPVYDDPRIFDGNRIADLARRLVPFTESFDAPIDGDSGFFWKNGQISGTDAIALYGMIKMHQPKRVIEIGSGFSTHIIHRALAENGNGSLTCIDPEPRTSITDLEGVNFLKAPLQKCEYEPTFGQLQAGDIVFYDGSHTVKTGSDTVFFYLKVLPYLPDEILVHSHDVRLPYPRTMKALTDARIYWGEMYLLMAHLHNLDRYQVEFASTLLSRRNTDLATSLMHGKYPAGGSSIWYAIKPRGSDHTRDL